MFRSAAAVFDVEARGASRDGGGGFHLPSAPAGRPALVPGGARRAHAGPCRNAACAVALEADVLDANGHRFEEEVAAVQGLGEEVERRLRVIVERDDVGAREDGREVMGPVGS